MATNLAPVLKQRYFDSNGVPLAGGKLYTYQSGTTTPQATYTDSGGATPNANPVVLDANGEANVWLDQTLSYKFVLKNSSDVTQWTTDGVIGILAADTVTTAAIQNLAVTTAKLADDSVTAAKLKDSASVDGDRAVTTDHIRDANVTRAKLATGAQAKLTVVSKTANYTATDSDDVILCSASGGAFTITLPAVATFSGKLLWIKKTDSSVNAVTIDGNASETIDASLTKALSSQYESVTLFCNGSSWEVIDRRIPGNALTYTMVITGSTSNPTKGTTTNDIATYSRRGDRTFITYRLLQSGAGAAGSGTYIFSLPTGFTINTTNHPVGSVVGAADSGVGGFWGTTYVYSSTGFALRLGNEGNASVAAGAGQISLASATREINFTAEVSITGWEG